MPDDTNMRGAIEQEMVRARRDQRRWARTLLGPSRGQPYLAASLRPGARIAYRACPAADHGAPSSIGVTGLPPRLPYPDGAFAHAFVTYASRHTPPEAAVGLLQDVRRVLRTEGRIAVVRWPVAPWMLRRPFRREYDTLAQWCGEELQAHLAAAGFRDVRLRFKPDVPVAAVCATATRRPPVAYFFPPSFFLSALW